MQPLLFAERPDIWVAAGAGIIIASGLFILWRESRAEVSDKNPVLRTRNIRPDTGPALRTRAPNDE